MLGKTVLITGGTAGIGLETAKQLAAKGFETIITARNAGRGAAAVDAIKAAAADVPVHFIRADVSTQAGVDELAAKVSALSSRLDVLVNNVGAMFGRRRLTADGFEMTFAVNHLAAFRLTHRLLPALRRAGPGRIVNVASRAHEGIDLDFTDLQNERRYNGWRAYKRSKLCNIYFTYALARRLRPCDVTVNALHPGFVATDIGVAHGFIPKLVWRAATLAAIDVEAGARTSVFVASAPESATKHGTYYVRCAPARSSPISYDEEIANRLWSESLGLNGLSDGTA